MLGGALGIAFWLLRARIPAAFTDDAAVLEAIDLNLLVEEIVELLGAVVSKKARLRLDLEPDLPAVRADAGDTGVGNRVGRPRVWGEQMNGTLYLA